MDCSIADLEKKDVPFLDAIKPDTWSSIEAIHDYYLGTGSAKCVKAISPSNGIMGIGTGLVFGTTGWLAHIIVDGKFQNRGIGTGLVENRVTMLRGQYGCKSITLTATDQGYPLYKKIGFREQSKYIVLTRNETTATGETDTENICGIGKNHVGEVLHIDQLVSGENRSEFLLPTLQTGLVYVKNNIVYGFYVPGFGDGGVYALTEEAGIALLHERIRDDKPIFIPEENETGYQFLLSAGYTEVKRIHRMLLGEEYMRKPELCFARIGGFAG